MSPTTESAGAGTLYLVHVLTHASRSRLDAELADPELSSFQYTALSVLAQNENLSSSRLSRRFYVTPQAMGEFFLLLERRGLIECHEDATNKKALLLSLTRRGRTVWAEADAIAKRLEESIFGNLARADLAMLRTILNDALAILREQPAEQNGKLPKPRGTPADRERLVKV